MSYIVLNGVKSTLIQGLLISSLPPITKPSIRTNIETIDGRDGDIVTKLGFSAYDKTMTIGLFGDFDIDEVINYFNSEGTVIFSNEPDKFYQYQILEQIDFKKLINFKTATVTFHVQPFKYSAVDDKVTVNKEKFHSKAFSEIRDGITVTSASGVVTISGTAEDDVEFYVPIEPMEIDAYTPTTLIPYRYYLTAGGDMEGTGSCIGRIITDLPVDSDSLGGSYFNIYSMVITGWTLSTPATKIYKYLWLRITSGMTINLRANVSVQDNRFGAYPFKFINAGNIESKPIFNLTGYGVVHFYINNVHFFVVDFGSSVSDITVNLQTMDAYSGSTLKNRSIEGDLSKLSLKMGLNELTWYAEGYGYLNKIIVERESRWI